MNLHVKSDRDGHYGASGATPPDVLLQSASTLSKPDDRAVDRDWKVKSSDDSGPPLSSEAFDITAKPVGRFAPLFQLVGGLKRERRLLVRDLLDRSSLRSLRPPSVPLEDVRLTQINAATP